MRMYFNEDFESHNKEVNEIIDDLGKKGQKAEEGYDRESSQKTKEAMQAENKKFDELKTY